EEASKLLDTLTEVFINMKKPEKENGLETLKIAVREGLTYYDAAYIQAAVENKLTLVTDDEMLYRVAKKFVKTMKSNELDL
ncbi:MAG: type II toxin-antitoxin system VapC family toxin, partial [Candidatus Bathyarchaeia archaeon]